VVASSATSVAVSKPIPNRRPPGRSSTPCRSSSSTCEDAGHQPAVVQLALELGLVVVAVAHRSKDAQDPARITTLSSAIR